MRHRHLDSASLSVAAVASILERGGASDLRALFAALHVSPERQAKTLGEMGCERLEELTTTQAAQLIERMDKALKAKNAEATSATTAA